MIDPALLSPSQRVRIDQAIQTRMGEWTNSVVGTIIELKSKPTGSWFAHGKNDKLWLHRLRIVKDDGEIDEINLDENSIVTILKQTS